MTLIDHAPAVAVDRGDHEPRRPSPRIAAWTRAVWWMVGSLVWAALCVYVLNASIFIGLRHTPYLQETSPLLAALTPDGWWASTMYLWFVLVFLRGLTGRTWVALTLMLDLVLVLAAVNVAKLSMRDEPLVPSDVEYLSSFQFLLDMVPRESILRMVVAVFGVTLLMWTASRLVRRRTRTSTRVPAVTRWLSVLVAGGLLVATPGFHTAANPWRRLFEADVKSWARYSQHDNYVINGFLAGALYDLPVAPMEQPAGYTRERMDAIVATYAAKARRVNASRQPAQLDDTNVVVVLSESLSDPRRLRGVQLQDDPMPRIRSIMHAATSGELLVGAYGGGTANTEFQVLTGLRNEVFAPQLGVPFQQLVPKEERFPSLVPWFGARGHATIAVHPFSGEMYRRREAYPRLGISSFVEESDLGPAHDRRHGRYVDDSAAFDEVVGRLRQSQRPLFANLVTMQNHQPYAEQYPDPVPVRIEGASTQEEEAVGQYVRGLSRTDRAVAELLDDLRRLPEPSVVVFYGDHLPSVYPAPVKELNPGVGMYRTPFFIWRSDGASRAERVGTISPNQLLPLMLETMQARVPPYVALLDAVRAQVPATQRGVFVLPDGTTLDHEEQLPEPARRALEDYRLVQYDLAVGNRWSEAGLLDTSRRH